MLETPPTPPPLHRSSRRAIGLAGGALLVAVFAAYANSFSGPFLYDDETSILQNPTIQAWWRLGEVFSPPGHGATVSGRPVLNLSFAINYAFGGLEVGGYHVLNVAIHAFAALALFGLVRRTLLQPALRERFGDGALPIAFTLAALWALHPLQTEAITYVVQRAESLMTMFYLLTLYAFVRSVQSASPPRWQLLAFVTCLLGMATKENMVSAPILVLLFDRAFVAGSFAAAWRQRARFYGALAATWILLAALVASTGGTRGNSAGFGVGVSWWDYALTQFPALAAYLRLSFWPRPLVFDYGQLYIGNFTAIWPQACLVAALIVATGFALWRRPALGFLGALFFAILAPTSLLPGTTQMIVEHRMYLPLAAVLALLVPAIYRLAGRRALVLALMAAGPLGYLTFQRNADYRDEIVLWQDTVAKAPANATAYAALGGAFSKAGRTPEAIAANETALRLRPHFLTALCNLGNALTEAGRPAEALPFLTEAVGSNPDYGLARINLGVALDLLKKSDEARVQYAAAVRLIPGDATAQNNFGDALSRARRDAEGIAHLREALRLKPNYAEAHFNLATALARAGQLPEAQAQFAEGCRLKPDEVNALSNWGCVLLAANHAADAIAPFETVLRLRPADPEAHFNFGTVLAALERYPDALREYTEAVRLRPGYAEAHNNLGNTLLVLDRPTEAIPHYEESLRLKPANPSAHNNLGLALARTGRLALAATHFAEAVRLAPNYQEAKDNLAHAREELASPP